MMQTKRSEGWRLLMVLLISVGISFVSWLLGFLLGTIINTVAGQHGVDTLVKVTSFMRVFYFVEDLLVVTVITLLCKRFVFGSPLKWYIALPVVLVVYVIFDLLNSAVYGAVINAVLSERMAPGGITVGQFISVAGYLNAFLDFLVWLAVSYLLQRFVLYRNTLDGQMAKSARPSEMVVARADTIITPAAQPQDRAGGL